MFVHLRTHSYYSFLEALPAPAELALAASQAGLPALALTDHQGLCGAVEFYDACRGLGIQPLLGLELDVHTPPGSYVFLAMNMEGWRSLCRLSSLAKNADNADHSVPVTPQQLAEETAGLICLTGGRRGPLAGLLREGRAKAAATSLGRLAELFPGRLYVELQLHDEEDRGLAQEAAALARRMGLPVVASHSVYMLKPEQTGLQRVQSAIRLNRPLSALEPRDVAPPAAYFLNEAEMAERFAAFPRALVATLEIAERCRLELPLGTPHFPALDLPPGVTPMQALREKAEEGARRLYGHNLIPPPPSLLTPAGKGETGGGALSFLEERSAGPVRSPSLSGKGLGVRLRLDHELSVIDQCGYASLFLVMEEILRYARGIGVPVSSRGSAASSLVAHCLGITSPDPLHLNLYFERFLNPARATPPDIDTDLCSRRREEVIRFVYNRFGADRVAMVCTVSRFRRRSALREVAKAYGLSPQEIKKIVDGLPYRGWGPPGPEETSASPFGALASRYSSPRHQAIFRDATGLLGLPHYLSVHPGGMVIGPGALTDLVPTQLAAKGVIIAQFDMDSIERMGLVKIDLLGIRGLTVLGDVAEMRTADDRPPTAIGRQGISTDDQQLSAVGGRPSAVNWLDAIPEDDPLTARLVQAGRTIGCFQIESPGMRATLKEVQADSVDDIMVALALYRPGPLTGGLKDAFVRRHRGEEGIAHLHPALAPLLEDTYGVILYQEQVLRIAHELAGLSLADADLLRRAMSHFDPGKQMQTLKEKFIAGAQQRHAVPETVSERVWELMAAFAGYGFPKAHAASYAQVAWRSAWSKVHYPALFMASVLANWGGYYRQGVYLTEARRIGLAIRPPHINWAQREFSVTWLESAGGARQPVLFMGLEQVRDLTRRTQERILRERPFVSLEDFLERADPRPVEAENLVRVGALQGLGPIPGLLHRLEGKHRVSGQMRGQMSLFSLDDLAGGDEPAQEEWSLAEQVAAQEALLGASVAAHPLELVAGRIADAGAITTVEAAARLGRKVRVAGMRMTWRCSRSARGEAIYFMSLEDLEGMLEVIIPAAVYRRAQPELSGPGPYLVEGAVELDQAVGEPVVWAENLTKLLGPHSFVAGVGGGR
jgi:DNA-directed DNA polymerase III PolC